MLKQESASPSKKGTPFARTKSKLHVPKLFRAHPHPVPPPAFNDPLYEHLDGEVLNREQHNFGPWVEHERLKSRQRGRKAVGGGGGGGELPVIYRPQDTTSRYYQQLDTQAAENNENAGPALPNIRERNQRAFSLQNLRPASLQFNPGDDIGVRTRANGTKTPFFLKMHGYSLPKETESDPSTKRSNFIYNYCLHEGDGLKLLPTKFKDFLKPGENYLKLMAVERKAAVGQTSTNELLFRELKQHRINKLK